MKFLSQGFQWLQPEQDTPTDTCTDADEHITMPHCICLITVL